MISTTQWTLLFSPTIPTKQVFDGPPVTPVDCFQQIVTLPVPAIPQPAPTTSKPTSYSTLMAQFCQLLLPWQIPLFGPLSKLQPTNMLFHHCCSQQPICIVSDASVQKTNHSSFAWIIVYHTNELWWGVRLAPWPAKDMYSGHAEAFGLLAANIFLHYYLSCYNVQNLLETLVECYCKASTTMGNGGISPPRKVLLVPTHQRLSRKGKTGNN